MPNKIYSPHDVTQKLGAAAASEVATQASTGLTHAPAANTAAVVTLAASTDGFSNGIRGVAWSYDADPTGGSLVIKDGDDVVLSVDITSKGPGFLPICLKGTADTAMTVTLAAGGAAVTGKVNVLQHWVE